MSVDYCGFKYDYNESGGYRVLPKRKTKLPKSFFKYYALNEYNVDALTNMYVYATHPYQYNDPFDCNELLIEFNSWNDVQGLWEEFYDELIKSHPILDSACKESRSAYWCLLYKKLGLVSLVPSCDNYQMWSLYAQNSGFCVEFDVDKFPFLHYGPFPINYAKNIPCPIQIGKVGGHIAMLIQTNVKNDWWKYEDEWRLYVPNPVGFDMKYFGNEYDMSRFNRGDENDR